MFLSVGVSFYYNVENNLSPDFYQFCTLMWKNSILCFSESNTELVTPMTLKPNSGRVAGAPGAEVSSRLSRDSVPVDQHRKSGNYECPEMYTRLPLQQHPKVSLFPYFLSPILDVLSNTFQSKPKKDQQTTHKGPSVTWVSASGFDFSHIHTAVCKIPCNF